MYQVKPMKNLIKTVKIKVGTYVTSFSKKLVQLFGSDVE